MDKWLVSVRVVARPTSAGKLPQRIRFGSVLTALLLCLGLGGCGINEAGKPADVGVPIARIRVTEESPITPPITPPVADGDKALAGHGQGRSPAPARPAPASPAPAPTAPPVGLTFNEDTSPVVPVGVDTAGQLMIPGDLATLGWWAGGASPGAQNGFVVITGHATVAGTGAANAWWSATPGQVVVLKTVHGPVTYRVVSRTTYDKQAIPLSRWFPAGGPQGRPGLALITCADYRAGEWHANTVVEAFPT